MKILRVVGLGLLIVMLQFLVPRIFSGIEQTLVMFFSTLQFALGKSQHLMQAGLIDFPATSVAEFP